MICIVNIRTGVRSPSTRRAKYGRTLSARGKPSHVIGVIGTQRVGTTIFRVTTHNYWYRSQRGVQP